jgi:hypothetical protein
MPDSSGIPLRRCDSGYETLDGRYVIERQDDITECEHPMCEPLHRRYWTYDADGAMHWIIVPQWHVWDTQRNDYADSNARGFETKRDAVRWLADRIGTP